MNENYTHIINDAKILQNFNTKKETLFNFCMIQKLNNFQSIVLAFLFTNFWNINKDWDQ